MNWDVMNGLSGFSLLAFFAGLPILALIGWLIGRDKKRPPRV